MEISLKVLDLSTKITGSVGHVEPFFHLTEKIYETETTRKTDPLVIHLSLCLYKVVFISKVLIMKHYLKPEARMSLVSETQFPSTVLELSTVGTTLFLQATYKEQASQWILFP